jgi:hypothetical protein
MNPIKSVIKEELNNSYKLRKNYVRALEKLPRGTLVRKTISGHDYYYIAVREGKKVKYMYQGKMPPNEVRKYEQAKKDRKRVRTLLSETKKQIAFLEKSLNIAT